jgi:hypothetical protein
MSTQYGDETPKEVLAQLGRALADTGVRAKVSKDAGRALREAGVDVDRLPEGAVDALDGASDRELEEIGQACETVGRYSNKIGLGTNEFL